LQGFKLMGGEVIIPDSISIGKREPTKDIARVVRGLAWPQGVIWAWCLGWARCSWT